MKRVLLALLCACTFMLTGCFEEEGNDQGTISLSIPEQIIDQGEEFEILNLAVYLTGITTSEVLSWSFAHYDNVTPVEANAMLSITVNDPLWFGSDTLTIIMETAPQQVLTFDVIFTVEKKAIAPIINVPILDQTIAQGGTFSTVILANHVTDPDGDDSLIEWYATTNTGANVIASTAGGIGSFTSVNKMLLGTDSVFFMAVDADGLIARDTIFLTITDNEDEIKLPPEITPIPEQKIALGDTFKSLQMANYVTDPDGDDTKIIWSVSNSENLIIQNSFSKYYVKPKDETWVGSESIAFAATDEDGLSATVVVTFTVTEGGVENVAPVITMPIPNQEVEKGANFSPVTLANHVDDPDGDNTKIVWTHTTPVNYNAGIVAGQFGVIVKDTAWVGSETIILTATDEDGLTVNDTVAFTVLPADGKLPPVVTQIPNQTIEKGEKFTTIDLTKYVNDPDGNNAAITWDIVGPTTVNVVKILNDVIVTVVDPEWSGTAAVTFTAIDADGLKASCVTKFKVNGGVIIIPSNTWVFDKNKVKNTIQYSSTNPLIGQIPPTIDSTENPATDTTEILETTSDSITLYAKQDAVTAKSKYSNGLKVGEGLLAGVDEQLILDSLNANSDVIAGQLKAGFPEGVEDLTITFTDVTISDPELIELDNELRVEYTVLTTADMVVTMFGMPIPITAEITTENVSYYVVYDGPIPPLNWPQTIIEMQ